MSRENKYERVRVSKILSVSYMSLLAVCAYCVFKSLAIIFNGISSGLAAIIPLSVVILSLLVASLAIRVIFGRNVRRRDVLVVLVLVVCHVAVRILQYAMLHGFGYSLCGGGMSCSLQVLFELALYGIQLFAIIVSIVQVCTMPNNKEVLNNKRKL